MSDVFDMTNAAQPKVEDLADRLGFSASVSVMRMPTGEWSAVWSLMFPPMPDPERFTNVMCSARGRTPEEAVRKLYVATVEAMRSAGGRG